MEGLMTFSTKGMLFLETLPTMETLLRMLVLTHVRTPRQPTLYIAGCYPYWESLRLPLDMQIFPEWSAWTHFRFENFLIYKYRLNQCDRAVKHAKGAEDSSSNPSSHEGLSVTIDRIVLCTPAFMTRLGENKIRWKESCIAGPWKKGLNRNTV